MTRLATLLLLLIGAAIPARAAPSLAACGLANLLPSKNAVDEAVWKPDAKKCETDRVALMTIVDTYYVILYSTMTPMNSGWLGPGPIPDTLPAVVNGRLRRVLLSHPNRFAAICRNMTDLISRYDGTMRRPIISS